MPDTIPPPGGPAALRGHGRRTAEPANAGVRRASRSARGTVARAQRDGLHWRDIEWVDFTSEPDSGIVSPPEPVLQSVPAAPPIAPPEAPARPVAADPRSDTAAFDNVLRRFGAARTGGGSNAIPGLKFRFTRLPVARSALLAARRGAMPPRAAHSPEPVARATVAQSIEPQTPAPQAAEPPPQAQATPQPARAPAMPKAGSVVVYPRLRSQVGIGAAGTPPALAPGQPPLRSLGGSGWDGFPAAIATPVSAPTVDAQPAQPRRHDAVGERAAVAGALLRGASGVAATAANGLRRARQGWRNRPTAEPESALASPLTAAFNAVSRYVAARENRLRVTGIAALVGLLIALVAYAGGAVLARALSPRPSGVAPNGAVNRQLAMADKVVHPQQNAALPKPPAAPNMPPSDPASRAEFYMAWAKTGDAAAQYDVGVLYARGDGLVQDMASAATWFHAAAAQGNVSAEYNLGVMYERGLGVVVDPTEALNWYRSAADQNHPGAQFNLALAYANGAGGKQDFAAAARWYKRAAEQGLPPAMVNLAILFEGGKGVDRSLVEAYAWYSAAGERGDSGAKTRAGELFQRFSDKDKAQAQGLAATIGAALDQAQAKPPA